MECIGREGTAYIAGPRLELALQDGTRETFEPEEPTGGGAGGGGTGADPMAFAHTAHRALLADFLDAVAADRDPAITGEAALKVHRLIDALLRSGEERRLVKVA